MTAFLTANAEILIWLVKILLLVVIVLTADAYLTWFERKLVAHIQTRWGPHRVGPHGLLQPLADGAKFLLKEDPTPAGVDKFVYFLAPVLTLTLAVTSLGVVPFGPNPIHLFGHDIYLGIADLNIGILALFAITSLGVYGVALAGWSSNNKYSLLGGLRSSAQMVSYELALTMSVVGVLLTAGTFSLRGIIDAQKDAHGLFGWQGIFSWNIFAGPLPQILGFICFFIAAIAETNRVPFDLPEAEQELVAGFNTEYASFKFAMFFIAEYTSMIVISALCSILFFGGWLSPFPDSWTFTHYLPSVLLIPTGLWVIWDGLRYETIIGKVILPGIGTVLTLIGAVLLAGLQVPVLHQVNEFLQGPFWLLSKIFAFLFFYVWMRGTLPRFRYDQLMAFGWKLLLPVSLANVVITAAAILWRGY